MGFPVTRWLSLISASSAFIAIAPAFADTVDPNEPLVFAGKPYGYCYARTVPTDDFEQKGYTQVFETAKAPTDKLLHKFDWYSNQIYLHCGYSSDVESNFRLVRFGKWPDGDKANARELAIEFYFGGKLVASYSTLDIAGTPDNVSLSASHYTVIEKVVGFKYAYDEAIEFTVITTDNRKLTFDTRTGKIRKK